MADDLLTVGKITGHFGVQGGVKVFSYTQPMENITSYTDWYVGERLYKGINAKKHGKTIIAMLPEINSRELAEALVGQMVAIDRQQLSALNNDDYYWHQLIGLAVVDKQGCQFGMVDSLFETGANDVMVVKQDDEEMLIPYLWGKTVLNVDLDKGQICVDWSDEDSK